MEVLGTERPQGSFTCRPFLRRDLEADHAETRYENGVLSLTIPLAQNTRPRRVDITRGDRDTASQSLEAA